MKLHKDLGHKKVVPIKGEFGFYKCTCGNILPGYVCQPICEACEAELDWDSVIVNKESKNGSKN